MAGLTQKQIVTGAAIAGSVVLFDVALKTAATNDPLSGHLAEAATAGSAALGLYGLGRLFGFKPNWWVAAGAYASVKAYYYVRGRKDYGPFSTLPKHIKDVAVAAWHLETDPTILREFADKLRAAGHVLAARAMDIRAHYHAVAQGAS